MFLTMLLSSFSDFRIGTAGRAVQVCEDERVPVQVKRTRACKTVKLHKKLSGIKEHALKVGSFTWNSFLFPGHFSVQAFFLTEIGPVPWNRVNKLLSCSLLFHPSHFLCKREINY